jgi:hypothetical protein
MKPSGALKTRDTEKRLPVHPNSDRLAHDVTFGNLSPDPTVTAVIPVVTHHEIVTRSDNNREIPDRSQMIDLH